MMQLMRVWSVCAFACACVRAEGLHIIRFLACDCRMYARCWSECWTWRLWLFGLNKPTGLHELALPPSYAIGLAADWFKGATLLEKAYVTWEGNFMICTLMQERPAAQQLPTQLCCLEPHLYSCCRQNDWILGYVAHGTMVQWYNG